MHTKQLKHMKNILATYASYATSPLCLGKWRLAGMRSSMVAAGEWMLVGAVAARRARWSGGGKRSSSPRLFAGSVCRGGRQRRHACGVCRRWCERSSPAQPAQPPPPVFTSSLSQVAYFSQCHTYGLFLSVLQKKRMDPSAWGMSVRPSRRPEAYHYRIYIFPPPTASIYLVRISKS